MAKTIFKAIIFAVLLVLAAQASAFFYNEVEINPQSQSVFMSRNDNVGVLYSFINTSDEQKCIDVSTISISPYIDASFAENNFCLNAGQRRDVALSIKTTDAPKANYSIGILLEIDAYSYNFAIADITVGDNPSLEIIPYPTDICRGKDEYINVLVKNKTLFFQAVKLNAENEMLLPVFAQEEIYLDSFQEKNVKLYVHTSDSTRTGPETVSIYATTNDDYIKKISQINVKDCEGITAPNFEVTLSSTCSEVEKTKNTGSYFNVKNLSDSEQTFNISLLSDLPNYLSNSSVTLSGYEERTLHFDINARINDSTGDHNASLIVWNQNSRIEKSKCIRVKPTNLINIDLLKNNIDIRRCETGQFVFIVNNIGDKNQNIDFNVSNIPANVTVTFSDRNFSVKEKQQKESYMFVSVAEAANLGNYDLNVVITAKDKTFQKKVSFNVIEKASSGEQKGLLIESYPLQIQATENSSASITVKLRNNSDSIINSAQISLKSLPEGITSKSVKNISLNPGETKNSNLILAIGKIPIGRYTALLEAKEGSAVITKEIEIVIATATQTTGTTGTSGTGLTGLFGLGNNISLGLVIFIIVVLFAIAIVGLAPRNNSQKIWTKR